MAVRISSFLLSYLLSLCLLHSLEKAFALRPGKDVVRESHSSKHTYTVQLSSLMPSSICNPSSTVPNGKGASLKVTHKYGPCSQLQQDNNNIDLAKNIFLQDQARVDWINSRLSKKPVTTGTPDDTRYRQNATTLPAKSGKLLGFGNYIVTVGLGTPKEDLSLAFDTGSDLTWTQCQPCAAYCYDQKDAIFDPSKSTSYSNVSCASPDCSQLESNPGCDEVTSTCIYGVQYGDGSYTQGYFSKESLTLTESDVIENFLFGCGQNNGGLFQGIAGLLGLGRNKVSIVEQAAQQYNRLFSYCLPSTTSLSGYLTLGESGGSGSAVKYTPLVTLPQGSSFYGLNLVGISVNGHQLEIPQTAFQSGTLIDSGTVITRLPPAVYSALRSEFQKDMTSYPAAPGDDFFDTCYDSSGNGNGQMEVPKISFLFGGESETSVDLAPAGILYEIPNPPRLCLAFKANDDDSQPTIFGNVQQKTFQVVYDVGGARIGFGPGGCS